MFKAVVAGYNFVTLFDEVSSSFFFAQFARFEVFSHLIFVIFWRNLKHFLNL